MGAIWQGMRRWTGSAWERLRPIHRRIANAAGRPLHLVRHAIRAAFTFTPTAQDRQSAPAARPAPGAPAPARSQELASVEQMAIITAALARVPAKGDDTLPPDTATLGRLLAIPGPDNDFAASDMVRDCFGALGAGAGQSRIALATACHLATGFGLPSRLPLATNRAWRLLDPAIFEDEMADRLAVISQFIGDWHRTQQSFLCLEFGEIDLIEFLFESPHPGRHAAIMTEVMSFKALSNRRQGILRRIPHRVRKAAQQGPDALDYIEATRKFLDGIANSHGYAPIIEAAAASLDEIDKLLEKMRPPPANAADSAPAGGPQELARITPIKMPASELARPPVAQPNQPARPLPAQIQAAPLPPRALPAAPSDVAAAPLPPQAPPRETPTMLGAPALVPPPGSRRPPAVLYGVPPRPFRVKAPLSVSSDVSMPTRFSAVTSPKALGSPAPIPRIGPTAPSLPPPAASAPKATGALTGRITPPMATGRATPPPPQPRMVAAPAAPPPSPVLEAKASVTTLTVVPKAPKRRLPITKANKRHAVLRTLRGESAESVAASLGISAAKLEEWVDSFVTAGAEALAPPRRKAPQAPLSVDDLRVNLAEVLATAQMIERAMDTQMPRRPVLLPPPEPNAGSGGKRPRKKQG